MSRFVTSSSKKRFIAGAKCTQCNASDRVALITTATDEWIECVDCGHIERRPTAESLRLAESSIEGVVKVFPPIIAP